MAYTHIIDPVFFVGITSIVLQQTLSSHSFPQNIFFCLIFLVKEKIRKRTVIGNRWNRWTRHLL